jgi:hypothetical protein
MTSKIYCYLRVSTNKQDLQANKAELLLKVNNLNLNSQNIGWIEETTSGKYQIIFYVSEVANYMKNYKVEN